MTKKIFLALGAIFVILIALSMLAYKRELARVQSDPQKAYSEDLMKDGNLTELHKAVFDGDFNRANQLIQQGYNIHTKTSVFKFTPFHMSIFQGHTDLADLLLFHGAKINEISNFNQTPLHWAAFMGKTNSVNFLISKRADLEKLSEQGMTALHYAAIKGNLKIVKALVQNGAKIYIRTNQGKTAEELAKDNGKLATAQFLASIN
ncbi:MAG: ankyrin repeat domain-containing protein [Bdellovibrionaceae bacterium]|nr:ankyrin repeat domain-containing protein [Pseudobdellovibrionaceae bacterium]